MPLTFAHPTGGPHLVDLKSPSLPQDLCSWKPPLCVALNPRLLLCEDLLWFGPGNLATQLDAAFESYRRFCKENKIKQSQPPFTPKMVPRSSVLFGGMTFKKLDMFKWYSEDPTMVVGWLYSHLLPHISVTAKCHWLR